MEKKSKIVYDTFIKHWTESGIFRGYPSISKGLAEFLKECGEQVYWSEIENHVMDNSWLKFKNLLEDLANELEENYRFGKHN